MCPNGKDYSLFFNIKFFVIYYLGDDDTKTRKDIIYSLTSESTDNKTEVSKPISIKSSETSALSLFTLELDKQSQEAISNETSENLPPRKLKSLERKNNISKVAKAVKHSNLLYESDSSLRRSISRFSNKGRKRSAPALVNLASPELKWRSPQTKKARYPAIAKRNAKGETPLHIAVIKVGLEISYVSIYSLHFKNFVVYFLLFYFL